MPVQTNRHPKKRWNVFKIRAWVFRIEGNCDSRGTEEYNIGLGERRAQAAKEYLISLGVEAIRIQTVSYGKERASGTSEGSPGEPALVGARPSR